MSKEETLLELVLDKFSNIKEVLSATKDIEIFLTKLKLNKKEGLGVILEKTKNVIDSVYDHSVKIKEEFYNEYNALKCLTEQKNNDYCENSIEENTLNNNESVNTENSGCENENQRQGISNVCIEGHIEPPVENEGDKISMKENADKEVDAEGENHENNVEEDPLKGPTSPSIIESSILEDNEDKENADNEKELTTKNDTGEDNKQHCKSLIRLVDLSKLIDPKQRKSVKFDNSIIILTSSDEETQTPKKTNCGNETGSLKSALKNTLINKVNGDTSKSQNKTLLTEEWSKSRSESDSEGSDSDITLTKILQTKKKNEREVKNNKTLTECLSDSGVQEEQLEEEAKDKKSKNKNKSTTQCSSESESVNLSDNENISDVENKDKWQRKSSRIKTKQITKQTNKENLKKLFSRRSVRSGISDLEKKEKLIHDGSSDSESTSARKSKPRKKLNLTEKHLSDTSSLSSSEIDNDPLKNKPKKNKSSKQCDDSISMDVEDEKLKYEVYIPLPRIECEWLKRIYLKNKEIFEIKRLTNLNLSKNKKRSRSAKNDNEKSSSDAEKPKNKKSKNVASEKEASSEDDSTSDNEPLKKLSNDVSDINKDLKENAENDECMADIAMEKLNDIDKEKKSESTDGESEMAADENNKEQKKKGKTNLTTENGDKTENKEDDDAERKSNEEVNDKEKAEDGGMEKIDEDKSEDAKKTENSNDSDSEGLNSNKKKWRKDKLLTSRIDSTDSEEEFKKYSNKKDQSKNESGRKVKKRVRKAIVSSDSEGSGKDKKEDAVSNTSNDSSDEDKSDEENKEVPKKKSARKRIRKTKDSSSSSDEDKSTRKNIRRVMGRDSLSETTKQAEAEEKERKARIAEKQKKYNKIFEATAESKVDKLILDYDDNEKKELLAVNKKLVKKLKPHQASGVQFMWDACFESVERAKNTIGSGCILAHCMGLGKTLQVITLAHTLLTNVDSTGVHKILVVCPLNTVLNWKSEFKQWLPKDNDFEVYELVSCKQNYERQYIVSEWHNDGGVLIIGYNMFRNLSNPDNKRLSKKMRNVFNEGFVDPGPDLVVCDEGHLLKNEKTHLSIAMNRIKTLRRIVLTGTPLQNNLKEYWCMVQFIKPNLLGTHKEYVNRFVNPITNGQYTDSTQHDILLMRKRSHVLHKLLDGVVQRRDYAVLEPYLPPKHEYVLFIQLTEIQVKIYKYYMEKFARIGDGSNRTPFLFTDFQELQRLCTHPRVLLDKSKERKEKEIDDEESEGSLKDFIDDGDQSSERSTGSSSSASNSDSEDSDKKDNKSKGKQQKVRVTRAQAAQRRENNEESDPELEVIQKEWFQEFCDGDELDNINNSGKLFLLFQILKECEEIGDKILVFSQSLYTLNCIEYFLEKIDEATQKGNTEKVGGHSGSWSIGLDYFRLDGSSSCDNRAIWCNMFNNPNNTRARLFLISTKAGGLGINLVAANRVIIFDVSWNPSHDIQSIYRVYRFGQTKPCYIYRFVSYGTMEMKIYERQVTKQAISKRVIDEQQIDRHYNQNDLQELYKCDLEPTDRPIPMVPKDVLLGEMLQKYEKTIYKYHLHQSLLENKEDEGLNEEERKAAWEEFENEKVLRKNTGFAFNSNHKVNAQAIETALASIVRKDNPTWSDVQIKGIIPALVQQLQVQLSEGDMTMYARVQQEIQLMQETQAQRLRDAYFQQQVMRMMQRQQQQANMMGNMYIDPAQLRRIQGGPLSKIIPGAMNQGGPSTAPRSSNDIIELND